MAVAGGILPLILDGVIFGTGRKPLIKKISCTIASGPRTVILGPNGAGKTLLLKLCHGLIQPTAGSVHWAGADGRAVPDRQALVFQRPVMLRRSVAANVDYPLKLRHLPGGERRQRIAEALARTGLARYANQPARLLSVGEQQRLALARVWALRPEVLFLDEPTASLDPAATRAVEEIIDAVHHGGTKIVMTTHDLAQAKRIADEVLFLHRGRLCEHAEAAAFFSAPRTVEASYFLEGKLVPRLRRVI